MSDKIVGIMWNKNEGDILRFIISEALKNVDYLLLMDDRSTDDSFDIMQEFKRNDARVIYAEQSTPNAPACDKRNRLLNFVRKRFKPEDTLVQIIESDITILDTNIREVWKKNNRNGIAMNWQLINATDPNYWVDETGCYPKWDKPVNTVMTHGHWMEDMSHYTFRPMPGLFFVDNHKPWPVGFGKYELTNPKVPAGFTPLLAHYGYRGPSHWYAKYNSEKNPNKRHPKHGWPIGSVEQVKQNVPFFNRIWNNNLFPLNRKGWEGRNNG